MRKRAVTGWWMGALGVAALCGSGTAARADRLLIQRGDALYVAGADGKGEPRRLFALGGTAKTGETLWAASPDGKRVAWLTRRTVRAAAGAAPAGDGAPAAVLGMGVRPAVAHVSDLSGRHEKRLFDTADLRDRQGKRVAALDIDPATTGDGGAESAGRFEEWEPTSLSWSADGRTLYLSCASLAALGGKATFAADAASGHALVDAAERWRSLTASTYVDARPGVLAGSGLARFTLSSEPDVPQRYSPVVIVNLRDGTRSPLYSATGATKDLPDIAFATWTALSPDGRSVAFVAANKGLWLVDRRTRAYRRLAEGAASRPRWSSDGKRILFLLPRPAAAPPGATGVAATAYDLYEVAAPPAASPRPASTPDPDDADNDSATVAPVAPPRLVLAGVDGFDLLPD